MKRICFAIILSALFMTACDNDDFATDGRSPSFEKLTLSPATTTQGEWVKGTLTYADPGKSFYKIEYTVDVTNNDVTLSAEERKTLSFKDKWDGEALKEPAFLFQAPAAGEYTVSVKFTRVDLSTGNANGGVYGSIPKSVSAKLTVNSNP